MRWHTWEDGQSLPPADPALVEEPTELARGDADGRPGEFESQLSLPNPGDTSRECPRDLSVELEALLELGVVTAREASTSRCSSISFIKAFSCSIRS